MSASHLDPAEAPPRGPHVPLLLAAGFLTAIPVPLRGMATSRQLALSLCFFPVIGALLGVLLAAFDLAARQVVPVGVVAAIDLVVLTLLTGGLHLDALMDTCDGVFGGGTVERRLEIMKDSRVGSFGVAAGVLDLLLQYACLTALPVERRAVVLVAVLALSRWAMVGAIVAFPPARPGGLGAAFRAGAKPWHAVVATVIVALVLVPVGWRGLAMLALAVLGLVIVGLRIRHSVGGLTGDSYGAINEVVMVLGLLGALAAAPW